MRPMRGSVFVTGTTGFLGRFLCGRIPARERDRYRYLSRRANPAVDLLEPRSYAAQLDGCETVLHLAAATGKHRPAEYFRVNTEGTRRLVEAARAAGVRNFLHVSSVAVKFRDKRRYYYAQSKQQAEEIVAGSGLRYAIVRPTMIFGPGAPVLDGLRKLARAPVIPVFGNGRARVQPVFVDDLADYLLAIVEREQFHDETLDVGGREVLTIEELLQEIRGTEAKVVHLPLQFIVPAVAVLEKFLFPLMPFTAGQLASFSEDGLASHVASTRTIEEMLQLSAIDERRTAGAAVPRL